MAEVKGDEWLPQDWKVEIRVRKSGKRDRYYTDPASGYVFRSLKDINRYLLTGKLGRRSMKSKHTDVAGGSDPVLDADEAPFKVLAEEPTNGPKKNPARNGKRKATSGGMKPNQKAKNKKISKSPCRKDSDDFFILDSDQGAEISNELGFPNLPEIIDSVRKSDATYLSAPEIATLLGGRQMPLAPPSLGAIKTTEARENGVLPLWSELPTCPEPESRVQENICTNDKTDGSDSPVNFPWGDICSDPCIEFAIKTLTGVIPLGSGDIDGGENEHKPLEAEKGESPQERNDHKGPEQGNE